MSDVITPALLRDWPVPAPTGDKHSRGTVLVVGGAAPTVGAVLLAGRAALRTGAGVLQLCCDPAVAGTVAVHVPEARVVGWPELAGHAAASSAIVLGPGLDDVSHAGDLLREVAKTAPDADLVVDAYALGALSHDPALLADRARPAVLTPSVTEATILEPDGDPDDLDDLAVRTARRYRAVVALRGRVAAPDGRLWREESGDVGLGTAGSGDVFAGLCGGLLARGADPAQAACWAAYTHSTAGQRLAARLGRTGFLARELADEAPLALAALQV